MSGTAIRLAALAVAVGIAMPGAAMAATTYNVLDVGPGIAKPCAGGNTGQSGACPALYNPNQKTYDTTGIGNTTLDLYLNTTTSTTQSNPLLILGVPDSATTLLGTTMIRGATLYSSLSASTGLAAAPTPAPTIYGLTPGRYADSATGYYGDWTSSAATTYKNVYSYLRLSGGGGNTFANWTNWDKALLPHLGTETGYHIYVYDFATSGNFKSHSLVNVTFASRLPTGSFAVGYAANTTNAIRFDTSFSQAGLDLPEPGTLPILGVGVAGLLAAVRRGRGRGNAPAR